MAEYYLRRMIDTVPVVTDDALIRYGYRDAIDASTYAYAKHMWESHVNVRALLSRQFAL